MVPSEAAIAAPVREKREPAITGQDARRALEVGPAAIESVRSGGAVEPGERA